MNNELPPVPKLARPWDLLKPSVGRVSAEVKKERLDICANCPFYMKLSKQCKKCGCVMPLKTELPHASCPMGLWDAVEDKVE